MAVIQRNAEVVREAFERWATDDFTSVLELYAPDIRLDAGGGYGLRGICHGREEVADVLLEQASRQPVRSLRNLELEESGDWVLAVADFHDGIRHVSLFQLRDGLVSRIEAAPTADEGRRTLHALGAGEAHETLWARIGASEFVVGRVDVSATGAALSLDGRRILMTLPAAVVDRVSTGDPVLAYFDDEGGLLGWYLPEQQLGVDLRARWGPA